MPLIFNDGPQSGWERGTGGTNRFLRDGGSLLHEFGLKSFHSWVGRGAGLGLQDWPNGEVLRVKVRALCMPYFLDYEWGDSPLNPGVDDLGSVRGRRVMLQGPGNSLEVLLGPGQADNPPKCRWCDAGSSIWLQRAQKAEGISWSLWQSPKPWQSSDFWRLVTILPSVDDEEAQSLSFW